MRIRQDLSIGENLRRLRDRAGLTQEQVAAQLQVMGLAVSREMLSQMQSEMSNARQFYLVMRFRNLKPEMVFTAVNEARKRMAEKGFEAHRLTKPELKRFLTIYLEASMDGDKLPDVDGGQYFREVPKNGKEVPKVGKKEAHSHG